MCGKPAGGRREPVRATHVRPGWSRFARRAFAEGGHAPGLEVGGPVPGRHARPGSAGPPGKVERVEQELSRDRLISGVRGAPGGKSATLPVTITSRGLLVPLLSRGGRRNPVARRG